MDILRGRVPFLLAFLTLAFGVAGSLPVFAQTLVGTPMNTGRGFELGADLGFGHRFSPSLMRNFQDWGAQVVTQTDGFPVRLGDKSMRFETREGVCGWDDGWSDCANGRSRHELSTSGDRDPSDTDLWFAQSFFLPADYEVPRNIGNSIFQLWSGGRDSFQFKFKQGSGFIVQRKLDDDEAILLEESRALGQWVDVLMQVRLSMTDNGYLRIWVNGDKVYDYAGRTTAGENPSEPNYYKLGIYNTAFDSEGRVMGPDGNLDGEGLPNLHLFFDEVRFARSCADLRISDLGYDCEDFTYAGADREQVMALQSALNELGCDVGVVDGLIGRRTVEAAFTCRVFGPGEMPATLSVSSLPRFVELYADAAQAGMPDQLHVSVRRAFSEIVGSSNDNAIEIAATADGVAVDFILIGHFDDAGQTDWLSILLRESLTDQEVETARQCPRLRVQTWGDGTHHAEVEFGRNSPGSWTARETSCLMAQLPERVAGELQFILQTMPAIAQAVVGAGYSGEQHAGLDRFLDMLAQEEVTVAGN